MADAGGVSDRPLEAERLNPTSGSDSGLLIEPRNINKSKMLRQAKKTTPAKTPDFEP